MKPQTTYLTVIFAILLLGSTLGWPQNFSTTIHGAISAIPCSPPPAYQISGKGDLYSPDYQQKCQTPKGTSFAAASSAASLLLTEIANATTQNGGAANSFAEAIQTATLKPPSGFHGNTVNISYTDTYALSLSGVAGNSAVGTVSACWAIAQLQFSECHFQSTNGKHGGKVSHDFVLKKGPLGFQLTILKLAGTDLGTFALGTKVSGGAITPSKPPLVLPPHWTCKYDSGTKCP